MPFKWTISHEDRLVSVTTEGEIALGDAEAYLDAVVIAEAGPYAKLVDMRGAQVRMSDHDLLMLGARLRAYLETTTRAGPVAFVVDRQDVGEYVLRFINLASGNRPTNVFATVAEARDWLMSQKK
jgi:hypothetical protein